jgi:hypothetical protein
VKHVCLALMLIAGPLDVPIETGVMAISAKVEMSWAAE